MSFGDILLLQVFTPTAVIAILAYFGREFFRRSLDRDLEHFRHRLELSRAEFQTKLSVIHQKRAEAIAETYRLLITVESQMIALTARMQPAGQDLNLKKTEVNEARIGLRDYFNGQRLYFDDELIAMMVPFLKAVDEAFIMFSIAQPNNQYERDETGMWIDAWNLVSEQLPPLKAELEQRFREMLDPSHRAGQNG